MPPVADFACLSKKCKTAEGESTVYELPLGSVRCPVCSSKRLTRLFTSAPMIASGMMARTEQMQRVIRPALDQVERPKLEGAAQDADDWRRRQIRERFAVRPDQVAGRMTEFGMNPALAGAVGSKINVIGQTKVKPFDAGPVTDPVIQQATPAAPNIIARYDGEKK